MILVDTSAWIEFLRGRGDCASQVDTLLEENQVAICGPILTELTRGFRSQKDKFSVLELLGGCRTLSQPDNLWEEAGELGFHLARKNRSAKTLDLLIAQYAIFHRVPLLTQDSDFKRIQAVAPELILVMSSTSF